LLASLRVSGTEPTIRRRASLPDLTRFICKSRDSQSRLSVTVGLTARVPSFWICRDFESSEWFRNLLHALEEQDLDHFIEIAVFVTSPVEMDDLNNIVLQE
jgi:Ferric reductase NAD binding domain